MLSGLGFLPGAGLFPRVEAESVSETVGVARNDGFLCVISDLSTLRSPFVTSLPLLISPNTAPKPDSFLPDGASSLICRTGGGPGGGGGRGGAPPAAGGDGAGGAAADPEVDIDFATSAADWPLAFQGMPLGKYCLTYSARSRNS